MQMSERMGAEHYREERAETAEALAELIIAEEFKWGQWQEADFKTRPKGDSVKVLLAARLRVETTMKVGVDRRTFGDGHARLPEPSLVSPEEAGRGVNNITDHFQYQELTLLLTFTTSSSNPSILERRIGHDPGRTRAAPRGSVGSLGPASRTFRDSSTGAIKGRRRWSPG
jgi:hypothetical protein